MDRDFFCESYGKWKKLFRQQQPLSWRDGCLDNAYCKECRYCCGPQGSDAPFPMALLPEQIGPQTEQDFYLLNPDTAYIGSQGCKSATDRGCRLPGPKRPLACGLFPIVLVNGKLYLYQNCPASLFTPLEFFLETAQKVAGFLARLSLEELRHISLTLSCEELASKYIDLHTTIFTDSGKAI